MEDKHITVQQQNISYQETDEITFKDLLRKVKEGFYYLRTKWLIICLVGILGAALGFLRAYGEKWTYKATLTFALEDDKGGGIGGALGLASTFGFDLGTSAGGAFTGGNLVELMKSRSLVEKTLLNPILINGKPITLAEYYIEFNELRKSWEEHPELKNVHYLPNDNRANYTLQQDSILGAIYEDLIRYNLTVGQKSPKVSIISIDVNTGNELFSKYFAEALAKEVSDFYVETKIKKAKLNLVILEHQTDSIRRELSGAISGVAAANDNTYALNPAYNIKRVPSQKRQVDVQANTAILTQLVTNLELARVTLRKETPLIQIIDVPILPLKRTKMSKTQSTLAGGFLAGFFIVFFLLGRRALKKITE